MQRPHLLHIFSPTKHVSPFDINMAYEARFDAVIPYCNVELGEVHGLTQDTIFSRSREGVRRTGIFIGGRDFDLALKMAETARAAMVPPFAVSVMADPSGAITTAAAMVALTEHWLARTAGGDLSGRRVCIYGGTGPVGMCTALLVARCGAECTIVSTQGRGAAQLAAERIGRAHGVTIRGADGASQDAMREWLPTVDVMFSAAKAGVEVVTTETLGAATNLLVAADANAVPPSGIAGVAANDKGRALKLANGRDVCALGALAIGDIKYKVHTALLQQMYETDTPVYLAHDEAFATARDIVAQQKKA